MSKARVSHGHTHKVYPTLLIGNCDVFSEISLVANKTDAHTSDIVAALFVVAMNRSTPKNEKVTALKVRK